MTTAPVSLLPDADRAWQARVAAFAEMTSENIFTVLQGFRFPLVDPR